MPIVDHGERRQRIAEIAAEVIAREGLDAATVRRIASEVGFSTTVVTHYFANKQELLLSAYRWVAKLASDRFAAVVARDPGDLVESLLCLTATDTESFRGWRVYVAFWETAKLDPVFAAEQRSWIEDALARIGAVIRVRYGDQDGVRAAAQSLIALAQGISIQALFDPQSWSREQVRAALAREVEMVLGERP
jgi:AcrR family transcriptional regulator